MDTHAQDPILRDQQQQRQLEAPPLFPAQRIEQRSIFTKLPPELVLQVVSYLDILAIFRFLDTCRYHRYLLLNLPDAWRRVRFVPLSEYANLASFSASSKLTAPVVPVDGTTATTTTVAAAAATALASGSTTATTDASGSSVSASDSSKIVFAKKRDPRKRLYPTQKKMASNKSGSDWDSSESEEEEKEKDKDKDDKEEGDRRLKHQENERDRDRGGSRSLISEIYAVLRRFRKENRLVDFVREIYMDSTDSSQFPSPLVMLIKFPNLEILSSRYRRHQTSLANDASMLRDMLRNEDILPHSLRLRRWEIFHPYMTKEEDILGFRQVLNDITIVGAAAATNLLLSKDTQDDVSIRNNSDHKEATVSGQKGHAHGVTLDIHPCPGPIATSSGSVPGATSPNQGNGGAQHYGGGLHWAPPPGSTPLPITTPPTSTPTPPSTSPSPPCTNIVWSQEQCRFCNAPQERCWQCVKNCDACKALRSPPFINHQTILERERAKHLRGSTTISTMTTITGSNGITSVVSGSTITVEGASSSSSNTVTTVPSSSGEVSLSSQDSLTMAQPQPIHMNRPRTPPGSISLTHMLSSMGSIPSAYPAHYLTTAATAAAAAVVATGSGPGSHHPQPLLPVNLIPEFSLFD